MDRAMADQEHSKGIHNAGSCAADFAPEDERLRVQIWNCMANVKFKAIFCYRCSRLANTITVWSSGFIALASSSSIAAWAFWQSVPQIWGAVVALSQVLLLVKGLVPFLKNERALLEMSYSFEAIYLEYEVLWNDYEDCEGNPKILAGRFFNLRRKEYELEAKHKEVHAPEWKRLIGKANNETNRNLNLSFGGPTE